MEHATDIVSVDHDPRMGLGGDDSPLAELTEALERGGRSAVLAAFAAPPPPEPAAARRPTPQSSHPRS